MDSCQCFIAMFICFSFIFAVLVFILISLISRGVLPYGEWVVKEYSQHNLLRKRPTKWFFLF